MRELFNTKQVFGISLKKIARGSQDARITFNNHTMKFFKEMAALEFSFTYAKCSMGRKNDKNGTVTLATQDSRFVIQSNSGATYDFQIKANDSTKFSGLKYEPTAKGSNAARLGKATVELVVRAMQDHKLTFDKASSAYPKTASEFMVEQTAYKVMIKDLIREGVDVGVRDEQEAIDNILFVYGTKPFVANAKLQQITWLHKVLVGIPRNERNEFCSDMIFLAMKVGRGRLDRYGPFAKIY